MINFIRQVAKVLPDNVKAFIRKPVNYLISSISSLGISIDLLGIKHTTDKVDHGYLQHYQTHFKNIRNKKLNILEIGVYKGESLRLWQDYFRNGMIYGLDIEDKYCYQDKRIKIFLGDQNDPSFLESVVSQIGGIDVIIDDGSHINEHIITSLNTLFPHLSQNGIYVIEDMHTAYLPSYGGTYKDLLSESTSIGLVKKLIDSLNHQYIPEHKPTMFDENIVSIHCYPKIVFIIKGSNSNISTVDAERVKRELELTRKTDVGM